VLVYSPPVLWLLVVVVVWQLAVAQALWRERRQTPSLAAVTPATQGPLVSVVVPARNEELRLGPLLDSLRLQSYAALEVIVVDDRSSDGTAALVEAHLAGDPRLRLLRNVEPPPGWVGKTWAAHQGSQQARGEILLFIDADVRLHPDCVARAVTAAAEADLLTLLPRVDAVGLWERAVQPLLLQLIVGLMPARKINDPRSLVAAANGPFMLFRRDAYARLGGHEAFRSEVIEDLKMARAAKAAGLRLRYLVGTEAARVRMYDSLGELWRGWSKNVFIALADDRRLALALAPLAATGLLVLYALPWSALLWTAPLLALHPDSHSLMLGAAAVAATLAQVAARGVLARGYGMPAGDAWLQPLGAVVVAAIVLNSALRAATGLGVQWKGRVYAKR
jgi:hypothetical protein